MPFALRTTPRFWSICKPIASLSIRPFRGHNAAQMWLANDVRKRGPKWSALERGNATSRGALTALQKPRRYPNGVGTERASGTIARIRRALKDEVIRRVRTRRKPKSRKPRACSSRGVMRWARTERRCSAPNWCRSSVERFPAAKPECPRTDSRRCATPVAWHKPHGGRPKQRSPSLQAETEGTGRFNEGRVRPISEAGA